MTRLERLRAAWPGIVGFDLASRSQIVDCSFGTEIVVKVKNSSTAQELGFMADYIAEMLAPWGVDRIRFRVTSEAHIDRGLDLRQELHLDRPATGKFMGIAFLFVLLVLAIGIAGVNLSPIGCGRPWC